MPSSGTDRAGGSPLHDAAPVLLVPPGQLLPASVQEFLQSAFFPTQECGLDRPGACSKPGFVVAFGANVAEGAVRAAATSVSAGRYLDLGDVRPSVRGTFATELDLTPAFNVTGTGSFHVCVPEGGLRDVRWLALGAGSRPEVEVDIAGFRGYDALRGDPPVSRPLCLRHGNTVADGWAVSLSGHVALLVATAPGLLPKVRLRLSTPLRQVGPAFGTGTTTYEGPIDAGVILSGVGDAVEARQARLEVQVDETGSFTGTVRIDAGDVLVGTARGRAVDVAGVQELRGVIELRWRGEVLRGGLRLTVAPIAGGSRVTWTLDGGGLPG